MIRLVLILVLMLGLFDGGAAFARGGGGSHSSGSSHSAGGTVHVHSYTGKSGTYVAPYVRHAPGTVNHSSGAAHRTGTHSHSSSVSLRHQSYIERTHYSSGFVGARDEHGRIVRSESAKREFMRMTGFPHGRPGYVVDHITALKRGGADEPGNMQWQTIAEAKAKDRWE
jgi:hypothetical protein